MAERGGLLVGEMEERDEMETETSGRSLVLSVTLNGCSVWVSPSGPLVVST